MKVALGIVALLVFGWLGWLVLQPNGDGDKDVSGKFGGVEVKASSKNSTNKNYTVDPSLPGNSPVPGLILKEGKLVEVIPARDFKWSCKGNVADPYNFVGPGGDSNYTADDERTRLPSTPFCGLIGRVGKGKWHYLGDDNTFISDSSGSLYLTANDVTPGKCPLPDKNECYSDNKGSASATVTVNVKK